MSTKVIKTRVQNYICLVFILCRIHQYRHYEFFYRAFATRLCDAVCVCVGEGERELQLENAMYENKCYDEV